MKKLSILCSSLLLALMMCFPVFASEDLRYVEDNAGLLTVSEQQELNDTLTEISERQGVDVAIITTDDMGDQSIEDYAKAKYNERGYGDDGALLVVNMEVRKWWMSTHGYGITAFTDAGISYISEKLGPSFKKEKYMKAFTTFGSLCEKFVEKAHNGKPYDVGNMPFKWLPWYCVPISLLVGFVCAVFVVSKKREQLHSVSFEDKAHNYMKKNTLKMKESHDYFLYHTITRNRIKSDDDDSSSGGSSTFTSSSGDTYGGGGGSF